MKLNYRDKVLLITVLVILVWVAGIFLFIKPAIEDVSKAQDTLDNKTTELAEKEKKIKDQEDLPERINTAYKEVQELSNKFYDYQSAQNAVQNIHTLINTKDSKVQLENSNMTISPYTPMTFSPYRYVDTLAKTKGDLQADEYAGKEVVSTEEDKKATSASAKADDAEALVTNINEDGTADIEIGSYDITFTFTGSVDSIKNFCQNLYSDKSLLVSNLTITDVSDSESESSVTLKMLVIKKLQDPNKLEQAEKDKEAKSDNSTDDSKAS